MALEHAGVGWESGFEVSGDSSALACMTPFLPLRAAFFQLGPGSSHSAPASPSESWASRYRFEFSRLRAVWSLCPLG